MDLFQKRGKNGSFLKSAVIISRKENGSDILLNLLFFQHFISSVWQKWQFFKIRVNLVYQ